MLKSPSRENDKRNKHGSASRANRQDEDECFYYKVLAALACVVVSFLILRYASPRARSESPYKNYGCLGQELRRRTSEVQEDLPRVGARFEKYVLEGFLPKEELGSAFLFPARSSLLQTYCIAGETTRRRDQTEEEVRDKPRRTRK